MLLLSGRSLSVSVTSAMCDLNFSLSREWPSFVDSIALELGNISRDLAELEEHEGKNSKKVIVC
jgi:hypothetical protein